MRVFIKVFVSFIFVFIFLSCRTSYYVQHWFAEREYQPVKKGKIEMIVREKAFPVSSSNVVTWQEAYDKGMKDIEESIKQFCDGKFILQKISEEKDRIATMYDTTHSSVGRPFSGDIYSTTVTGALPLYKHYTAVTFQCQ